MKAIDAIEVSTKIASNRVIIIMDSNGKILEKYQAPINDIYSDILENAFNLIQPQTFVQEYFSIPKDYKPLEFVFSNNPQAGSPEFPNQNQPFLDFYQEQGFYSSLPIFLLLLERLHDQSLIGFIRPTSYYLNLQQANSIYGLFCVDASERLVAVNKIFLAQLGDGAPPPEKILGSTLDQFLAPTPSAIQDSEAKSMKPPDLTMAEPIPLHPVGSDMTLSAGCFYRFPKIIDLEHEDFCVEFRLQDGMLPCLVLGDPIENSDKISDLQGYLLGPYYHFNCFILKKRGRRLYNSAFSEERHGTGYYRYYHLGRRFVIEKDGQVVFFYSDFDSVQQKKLSAAFYMRPNVTCHIRDPLLWIFPKTELETDENTFVSVKTQPNSFYLLAHFYHFWYGAPTLYYSIFSLQNLSDVKKRLDKLEYEHQIALNRVADADLRIKELLDGHDHFIGSSRTITRIRNQAEKAARSSVTILIEGPTGTGKENLARFIHSKSEFRAGPFLKVDCSALPASLVESLLFGHAKGAFTGAQERHRGLFEQADHGSLFLDELGNLDLQTQAKLLQFLQDLSFTPVGGDKSVKVNLRVIGASNVPLESLVEKGVFRRDLFYRLAVVMLRLPALSERMEDLPMLVDHFLRMFNLKYGRSIEGLSPSALRKLTGHIWPGNIRELKNALERAFLFCGGNLIEGDMVIFSHAAAAADGKPVLRKPLGRVCRSVTDVEKLFVKHRGIMKRVAAELNVTRQTLYNFLKQNGLSSGQLRKNY